MKIILRLLKWTLFGILGLVLLIFIFLLLDRDAQSISLSPSEKNDRPHQKKYTPPIDSSLYYSLLAAYGKNKVLAKGFEIQCLLALSHYPELKEVPIDFRVQPAFIPLSSRPSPITVLLPWVKRKYWVIISSQSADFFEKILLHNIPFNEQVGIIGHELAHSVFYLDKTSLQLARIAYNYEYNNEFQRNFERETDKRAVAHGLGYQLYDFAFFVRKAFGNTQEEIAQEEGGTYLSPREIANEMTKYSFYKDTLAAPSSYFEE